MHIQRRRQAMNDYNTPYNQPFNQVNQNTASFIGFVQNGKIFNSYGQQLGYVNDEYNKAIDTAKKYQEVLYEKGILTKPKTTEEINQELQDTLRQTQAMMAEMSNTIVTLSEKVNKMEVAKDVRQANSNDSSRKVSKSTESTSSKSSV